MLTDLIQIRRLGENKRDENERFRKHLKRHDFVERRFRRIAEEIEDPFGRDINDLPLDELATKIRENVREILLT